LSTLTIVTATDLPAPAGHYSYAVAYGGLLYISGQLGRSQDMTDEVAGDASVQTRRALSAIITIARSAGSDIFRLLKVNVYVTDVALWPAVNAEYAAIFGVHRPARAVIPVNPLHYGALVEIDAIAAMGSD